MDKRIVIVNVTRMEGLAQGWEQAGNQLGALCMDGRKRSTGPGNEDHTENMVLPDSFAILPQAKPYHKRYSTKEYRGHIPGRVDIAERPAIVDTRSRVGDWEADLIIGKDHKGAIVTLAERRSRLYLALPILRKTADLTTRAITTLLARFKDWTHTVTYDNGRKFSGHAAIAKALDYQGILCSSLPQS